MSDIEQEEQDILDMIVYARQRADHEEPQVWGVPTEAERAHADAYWTIIDNVLSEHEESTSPSIAVQEEPDGRVTIRAMFLYRGRLCSIIVRLPGGALDWSHERIFIGGSLEIVADDDLLADLYAEFADDAADAHTAADLDAIPDPYALADADADGDC